MAYMSQECKKTLAPKIKSTLKKHGLKGSISVRHYSTLVVKISQGKIPFTLIDSGYKDVHSVSNSMSDIEKNCITELLDAMNGCDELQNHDNSDIMTDYFDVGWYVTIEIGQYNKPYQLINN